MSPWGGTTDGKQERREERRDDRNDDYDDYSPKKGGRKNNNYDDDYEQYSPKKSNKKVDNEIKKELSSVEKIPPKSRVEVHQPTTEVWDYENHWQKDFIDCCDDCKMWSCAFFCTPCFVSFEKFDFDFYSKNIDNVLSGI